MIQRLLNQKKKDTFDTDSACTFIHEIPKTIMKISQSK